MPISRAIADAMAGGEPRCHAMAVSVAAQQRNRSPQQADQRIETQQAGHPYPRQVLKDHCERMVTATQH